MAGNALPPSPPSPSPLRPPKRMRPTMCNSPAASRPESSMSNASSVSEMEIPPVEMPHIPPIYIDFTPSWYTHAAAIHQLVKGDLNARSSKGEIVVKTTTIDNFRAIQKYLIDNKVNFFTRSLPGTRPLKVTISGLTPFTTPELISDALVEKNFAVGDVFKLKTSRGETRLWVVTLQPDRNHPGRYSVTAVSISATAVTTAAENNAACVAAGHIPRQCAKNRPEKRGPDRPARGLSKGQASARLPLAQRGSQPAPRSPTPARAEGGDCRRAAQSFQRQPPQEPEPTCLPACLPTCPAACPPAEEDFSESAPRRRHRPPRNPANRATTARSWADVTRDGADLTTADDFDQPGLVNTPRPTPPACEPDIRKRPPPVYNFGHREKGQFQGHPGISTRPHQVSPAVPDHQRPDVNTLLVKVIDQLTAVVQMLQSLAGMLTAQADSYNAVSHG
ncbi:Serine/threonine-protein kinase dclk1 [Homalodisca vitripennis]|nr:Serine/threonine-protein kinase dclk1 [Homalodisca vitripennis]